MMSGEPTATRQEKKSKPGQQRRWEKKCSVNVEHGGGEGERHSNAAVNREELRDIVVCNSHRRVLARSSSLQAPPGREEEKE